MCISASYATDSQKLKFSLYYFAHITKFIFTTYIQPMYIKRKEKAPNKLLKKNYPRKKCIWKNSDGITINCEKTIVTYNN